MASIVDPDPDSKSAECCHCGRRVDGDTDNLGPAARIHCVECLPYRCGDLDPADCPFAVAGPSGNEKCVAPGDDLPPAMRELADGLATYLEAFMGEVEAVTGWAYDVDYQYLAEDFVESCVVGIMRVDDCGHHSWAGLMSLLDEHWPDDIFPTRYEDDPKRGAGPRIVSLMRWVNNLQVKIQRVESLAADYDDGSEWGAVERPGYVVREQILQALAGDA